VWPREWVAVELLSSMTAALEGGEWSAARPGRTLPPGKTRYPFHSRLGGPQGRSGRAEYPVPTGIRSRTVHPVVSRYTDWATRPISFTFTIAKFTSRTCNLFLLIDVKMLYFNWSTITHFICLYKHRFWDQSTGMRRITAFRSTTNHIYDGGTIRL